MKAFRTVSDWLELWFLWFLVTGTCWSVGLVIAAVIVTSASPALSSQVSLLLSGIVVGALIGLVQQEVLRPGVRGVGIWTLATAVGWVVGLIVTATVVRMAEPTSGWLIGGALGGFVLGLAQLLALRPETGGRAGWLLLTVIGWTAALALGIALAVGPEAGAIKGEAVEMATSGAVGLVVIGIFAVLGLVLLFPEPQQKAVDRNVKWWP